MPREIIFTLAIQLTILQNENLCKISKWIYLFIIFHINFAVRLLETKIKLLEKSFFSICTSSRPMWYFSKYLLGVNKVVAFNGYGICSQNCVQFAELILEI